MDTKTVDRGMIAYERFLAGDEGGLALIIDEYGDRLLRYINSFVQDENTAEDLLSETFLKILTTHSLSTAEYVTHSAEILL